MLDVFSGWGGINRAFRGLTAIYVRACIYDTCIRTYIYIHNKVGGAIAARGSTEP